MNNSDPDGYKTKDGITTVSFYRPWFGKLGILLYLSNSVCTFLNEWFNPFFGFVLQFAGNQVIINTIKKISQKIASAIGRTIPYISLAYIFLSVDTFIINKVNKKKGVVIRILVLNFKPLVIFPTGIWAQ